MRHIVYFYCSLMLLAAATGCKSLIVEEEFSRIKDLEKKEYLVIDDIAIGERSLKKNDIIRLIITKADEWIKVEGYLAKVERLKAERVRILFLFDEDFPDKKFTMDFFRSRLFSLIKEK